MAKWVRIEQAAEGQITGYYELDFERIRRVQLMREHKRPTNAAIRYGDEPGLIILDEYATPAFIKEWNAFTGGAKAINPEGIPSIIEVPVKVLKGEQ